MRKIIIKGQVPSLKNQKQIFINRSTGRPFITSSQASKAWVEEASWQLKGQKPILTYPVTVTMSFTFKGKHRKDLDNVCSSVMDVLVSSGILADDDFLHVDNIQASFVGLDKVNPKVDVFIEES